MSPFIHRIPWGTCLYVAPPLNSITKYMSTKSSIDMHSNWFKQILFQSKGSNTRTTYHKMSSNKYLTRRRESYNLRRKACRVIAFLGVQGKKTEILTWGSRVLTHNSYKNALTICPIKCFKSVFNTVFKINGYSTYINHLYLYE